MATNNSQQEICILCDFVNEPTIDVGYAEWVTPNISNEKIEDIIEKKTEVVIYWPSCDTGPPKVMKKRLKQDDCTWKRLVTKIIAQGGWTEMCEQLRNHIKYTIAESTIGSSKKLRRRKSLSSDDSDDAQEPRKDLIKAYKRRKLEKAMLRETSKLANSMKKKRRESFSRFGNDCTSLDEDDEESHRLSIRDLMSTIETLREENRRLRADNARLQALKSVNEDLPEMKKLSTEILRNLRATSALVGLCSSAAESRCQNRDDSSEKTNALPSSVQITHNEATFPEQLCDVVQNTLPTFSDHPGKETGTRQPKTELPEFEESSNYFDDQSITNDHSSRISPTPSLEDGLKPDPDQEFPAQETVPGHQHFLEGNQKLEGELVHLGAGCLVDALQLSRCSRKNATKMTCDILSLVFTREELASSSLTGKVPNTLKKTGITAKKKLDPAKVAAISAFVVKEFSAPSTKSEILTAIKNKCNNTAKAVRRDKEKSINSVYSTMQ